ncbi:DUF1761 domain-containing protein [Sphingomonas sp. GB1N7]|uniref:DUF1761 domain-containing protein n=1 Tax=Parasphingomonas caseinilytica TaxID=3096158 RepID=UPI002FC7DD42
MAADTTVATARGYVMVFQNGAKANTMIVAISQMNALAVLAASVAHFVLGGIWFVGIVAKRYPEALGIADRPQVKPGALFLLGPFLCSALTIATTAILFHALGITTYGDALILGGIVGVGYLVPMTLNIAINPLLPRPFYYTLLNAPYFIAGSIMASAILVALG